MGPHNPGSKIGTRLYASVLALAHIMADTPDPSAVTTLEEAASTKAFPTLKAIALAGLAVDAQRSGTAERAAATRSLLASFAPTLDKLLFG